MTNRALKILSSLFKLLVLNPFFYCKTVHKLYNTSMYGENNPKAPLNYIDL